MVANTGRRMVRMVMAGDTGSERVVVLICSYLQREFFF